MGLEDFSAMEYEHAIKFVFGCQRGGVNGLADASVFRVAEMDEKWDEVAEGLKKCLEKIKEEDPKISWKAKDMFYGGGALNYRHMLDQAIKRLEGAKDKKTLYLIISDLIVCLAGVLRAIKSNS